MEYRTLNDGTDVPLIGLGTWGMGGFRNRDESNAADSINALRKGLSLGMNHIDTAEIYGAGLTEEIVGKAIKGFDRKSIIISSKFWSYSTSAEIINAVKGSLKRIGVSYLDFCIAHRPPPEEVFDEFVTALEYIVDNGLARHIGVSNFSVEQMEKTKRLLGRIRMSAIQAEYNLSNQSARKEYFGFCEGNGILVMAHRPLAKGMLAEGSAHVLYELARKYGKTPAQIALRWIIQQDNTVAIPKATNIAHLKENLDVFGWSLEEKDIDCLFSYPQEK